MMLFNQEKARQVQTETVANITGNFRKNSGYIKFSENQLLIFFKK